MLSQGGLLTEYMSGTKMDKLNFVRRNRIVAGMSDVTVVVESATHGGSLITASIANDYNREVAAFPGQVGAKMSEGCNALVRDQKAHLITSAEDLAHLMGWQADTTMSTARHKGFERDLFPSLTPEQSVVVGALQHDNDQQLNLLSVKTNLPMGQLSALLFELEMLGMVRPMAGGTYHLIV
jgi:DNA processing protein